MLEIVKLVKSLDQSFSLKKAYVNQSNIVSVEEDDGTTVLFGERPELFPEGLDNRQTFSMISISGGTGTNYITVVGSPEIISSKV